MFAELKRRARALFDRTSEDRSLSQRWIMLDVETTGLDPKNDQLLAIAAVALRYTPSSARLELMIGDSFEIVLRQARPSTKDNILIHHIGVQAQTEGCAPEEALEQFRAWANGSPLLAFHAAFDAAMIERAFRRYQLPPLVNEWLDIEPIARVVGGNSKARALDDWLTHFEIECAVRHQAASDAFATAELLLRLWPAVRKEAQTWKQLRTLARHAAWVPQ
ncbi:3'-5' exonuclease [Zwartia vadi]|uniref:3'-5' exonuclease n=1 Tax=Zwartia vadi TaxID=3058168 RepID=UPI0025B498D6|nr:3'-5' exonuclease [Zwartia vadi]MDN3988339.1 3'-5' exonuclease [Zwartia vadi]